MDISRHQAEESLAAVKGAGQRVAALRSYRDAAPLLLLWGAVWFVADIASEVSPSGAPTVWLVATVGGSLATVFQTVRLARGRMRIGLYSAEEGRRLGRRFAMLGVTVLGYFAGMAMVLGPMESRRLNAFISLSWTVAYMVAGAWLGARLFATGAVAALAIVLGYVFVHVHFGLWMAICAGGSLMLAGLWLRKV